MSQQELREKILQFAGTYAYSNLITIDASGFPKGRMMENIPVAKDMVFWFATGAQSKKVQEIKNNSKVSVFMYRPSDHSSISVQGNAQIVTNNATRNDKWKKKWTAYWKQGPIDPAYTLIKVVPKKIVYLDFPSHIQEVLDL